MPHYRNEEHSEHFAGLKHGETEKQELKRFRKYVGIFLWMSLECRLKSRVLQFYFVNIYQALYSLCCAIIIGYKKRQQGLSPQEIHFVHDVIDVRSRFVEYWILLVREISTMIWKY